jgi:hypothetical protein
MRVIHSIIKSREEMTDILCNQCGKSCKKDMNMEYATVSATWGYDSNHHDGEQYEIHLCEQCFDLLLAGLSDIGLVRDGVL